MQRLILIVLSALFFVATPALAKSPNWVVSQRSGDVRVVHRGLQPASVRVNTSLAPGDVVMTGATGRATLSRGADYIVVAPQSELRLPAEAQPGGFTRVVQRLGTMLFKVKHTGVPHFAVDTPMLAAVVKGTTFTVIVDKDRSAVQVIEGAVQVVATDGGMQRLVEGGNTVFIDRNNPRQLNFATPQTLGAAGTTSGAAVRITGSADESVAEIASLTTGLVRAEPVPAPTVAPTQVAVVVNTSAPVAGTGTVTPAPTPKDPAPTPKDPVPTLPGDDKPPAVPPVTDVVAVVDPIVQPIVAPVVDTVVAPVVQPVVDTVVAPIVQPVVDTDVAPIVAPAVDTVVAPLVAPVEAIVQPIVEPVVETVITPVVETVVAPVVETVVAPIVEALPIVLPPPPLPLGL